MTVELAGIYNVPLKRLAAFLAQSATFQTLTGAEDAEAAGAFIYFYDVDEPVELDNDAADHEASEFPPFFALIDHSQNWKRRKPSHGMAFVPEGALWVYFDFTVPVELRQDRQEAVKDFMNQCGAINAEIEALCGDLSIDLLSHRPIMGPVRSSFSANRPAVMGLFEWEAR